MTKSSNQSLNHPAARRGVATLEFVMALPLLFVLMLCIMWEGFWLIGRAEVTIQARNDTWKERFKNLADNPLSFPILPEHDLPVLPKYNKAADYATKQATTKIKISPVFDLFPGPRASDTILAGSWDFEAMPLDTPPDLKLMGKAALIGAFGAILDLASSATDPLGLVKKFASAKSESKRIESETESEKGNVGEGGSEDASGGGTGTGGGTGGEAGGKTPEQAQKDAKKELEAQKKAVQERFKALGGKIDSQNVVTPVNGELDAALDAVINAQLESARKSEAARNEANAENKKKLQDEAARANRKYELAKIKLERLKAECISVTEEAEGLGINRIRLNLLVSPIF
jgi:hypothetical protein